MIIFEWFLTVLAASHKQEQVMKWSQLNVKLQKEQLAVPIIRCNTWLELVTKKVDDLNTAASGLSLWNLNFWHDMHIQTLNFSLTLMQQGSIFLNRNFWHERFFFLPNQLRSSSLPFVMSKTWEKRETHIIQELTMNSGTFECLLLFNSVSQWSSCWKWDRIAVSIFLMTSSEAPSLQPLRQAVMYSISWAAMPMSCCKSVLLTITSPNPNVELSPEQLILAIDRGFCQGGLETLVGLSNTTVACER